MLLKGSDDLFGLALAQEAVVDKDTGQAVADGTVDPTGQLMDCTLSSL